VAAEGVTFATFGNDGTGFLGNARGTGPAVSRFVATAYRYEDLHVWQLAAALRDKVCDLTESGVASRDFDFRDQIRSSSSSAPANIAEGFGRFEPGEFAYFLRIARGSLLETRNHLQDARARHAQTASPSDHRGNPSLEVLEVMQTQGSPKPSPHS